ncbi:reverse transcriptase [Gossypium australe]|uniref:Reverse transcriptase n=1 Tax=Gossypium australe TaxID=47621 RepID=A0A5B6WER7_9ROSI|nr:reverse transcriptase [Gossypium australe]
MIEELVLVLPNYTKPHEPKKAKTVTDALSRKMNQPDSSLLERIQEGLFHYPTTKTLIELTKEGETKQFLLERKLLYTQGHCFVCLNTIICTRKS